MPRLRTLIVDDHPAFLDAAAAFVRGDANCELCGVARSGAQALDLVGRLAPDLVLLDVYLGDLNGFVVAAAIRAALPTCRVLMMSLNDFPAYRSRSREIGAAGFIAKAELFRDFPGICAALAWGSAVLPAHGAGRTSNV